MSELGRSLDIATLFVHRDMHHQGIGALLVECVVGISREHTCDVVSVWSDPDAIGFYEKVGFEPIIQLNNYLLDVGSERKQSAPLVLADCRA